MPYHTLYQLPTMDLKSCDKEHLALVHDSTLNDLLLDLHGTASYEDNAMSIQRLEALLALNVLVQAEINSKLHEAINTLTKRLSHYHAEYNNLRRAVLPNEGDVLPSPNFPSEGK